MPQLPPDLEAFLFDMDGVLTDTAKVHAKAWKETFDPVLAEHGEREFDPHADYVAFVDGKPREAGVRDFLASRGITPPDAEVERIGTRKNDLLVRVMERDGVEGYEGSKRFVQLLRERGLKTGIVSSSANAEQAIAAAGYPAEWFDVRVDGVTIKTEGVRGKPAPDTFLLAAERLGVPKERCAVLEDALVGVRAGAQGGFGYVIGVDRAGQRAELTAEGADVVIDDLAELELPA